MRLFLLTLLLTATFLVGYHLGHQPNSPDVTANLLSAWKKTVEVTDQVVRFFQEQGKESSRPPSDVTVVVQGKSVNIEAPRQDSPRK